MKVYDLTISVFMKLQGGRKMLHDHTINSYHGIVAEGCKGYDLMIKGDTQVTVIL